MTLVVEYQYRVFKIRICSFCQNSNLVTMADYYTINMQRSLSFFVGSQTQCLFDKFVCLLSSCISSNKCIQ